MRTRLYVGLKREGKWYRHAEVETLRGGALAVLDGDRTGASRIHNIVTNTVKKLYNDSDEEYIMEPLDYGDIVVNDTWRIARTVMKMASNKDTLIFPEQFYCPRCSRVGMEKYTQVEEDWDKLVEDGWIDEIFLEGDEEPEYDVILPIGIEIASGKTIQGGLFTRLRKRLTTIGDMIKIQKSEWANKNEANMICSIWDSTIIEVEGMSQREFNIFVKRSNAESFTKKYLINQADIEAMEDADALFKVGYDPSGRSILCNSCGEELGGSLDFTNFFQPLLSNHASRRRNQTIV